MNKIRRGPQKVVETVSKVHADNTTATSPPASGGDDSARRVAVKRVLGDPLGKPQKHSKHTASLRGSGFGLQALQSKRNRQNKRCGGMLMAALLAFQMLAPTGSAMASVSPVSSLAPSEVASSRAWELRIDETSTLVAQAPTSTEFVAFDDDWQALGPEVLPEFVGKAGHYLNTTTDIATDGKFIGAGRTVFSTDTLFELVTAVKPQVGSAAETVVLLTGIMTDSQLQLHEMQALADAAKVNVIGIRNATAGMLKDVTQTLGDKFGIRNANHATDTTAQLIYTSLSRRLELHLVGHSQGAVIISEAVRRVMGRLADQGLSQQQIEAVLAGVHVSTFAGAATHYPDGPRYDHWVNRSDAVPLLTGIGMFGHPGKDAQIHFFSDTGEADDLPSASSGFSNVFARWVDQVSHGLSDIYLPQLGSDAPDSAGGGT